MDPVMQSLRAIERMEWDRLEPEDCAEEGDDEQTALDAQIDADNAAWQRMREEGYK